MKTIEVSRWLLLFLASAMVTPCDWGQAEGLDDLVARLDQVATESGSRYLEDRSSFERVARDNPDRFRQLAAHAEDWRVRVLSGIILERVEKHDAIRELAAQEPRIARSREDLQAIALRGAWLAQNGSNVPMAIVELFWKGNELDRWGALRVYGTASCAASALAILKEERGRQVLESAITDVSFWTNRYAAAELDHLLLNHYCGLGLPFVAKALQSIGDARSVPVLLQHILATDPDKNILIYGSAVEAVSSCVDETSRPYLEEALAKANTPRAKAWLQVQLMRLDARRTGSFVQGGKTIRHEEVDWDRVALARYHTLLEMARTAGVPNANGMGLQQGGGVK